MWAPFARRLPPEARKACLSALGPPPEHFKEWYRTWHGDPIPQPEATKEGPRRLTAPILDTFSRLTATELDMRLRQGRATLTKDVPEHERLLCE
jgi:hypothetical protein